MPTFVMIEVIGYKDRLRSEGHFGIPTHVNWLFGPEGGEVTVVTSNLF